MREFDLIGSLLRPLATDPGALGLMDDAALLAVPDGFELVLTKDLIVEGTHFLARDPADTVAWKLLGVNLSDLAAKGAVPRACLLGLNPGDRDEDWVRLFVDGLKAALAHYEISLLGGDTVSGKGPAVLSLTALGLVPAGTMLKRSGARAGDLVFVSGTLGDASLGLTAGKDHPALLARYRVPQPRLQLGAALKGVAHACADISDGLLADLGHIAKASGLGARVELAKLPVSDDFRKAKGDDALIYAGGDDYELVFTLPPERAAEVLELARKQSISLSEVGVMTDGEAVHLIGRDGREIHNPRRGYEHQ